MSTDGICTLHEDVGVPAAALSLFNQLTVFMKHV